MYGSAVIVVLALAGLGLASDDFLWDAPPAVSGTRPHPPLGDVPLTKQELAQQPKSHAKSGHHRAALPASFDAAKQWPQCDSIKTIRNQGPCNTCWAVAAASVLSDRFCIHAGKKEFISANQIAGCVFEDQTPIQNCQKGGNAPYVYRLASLEGLPSGGEFNSSAGCVPYTVGPVPAYSEGVPISCSSSCTNKKFTGKLPEDTGKHQIDTYWVLPDRGEHMTQADIDANVALMQEEISKNGPISTRMTTWADFYDWKKADGPYKGPAPGVKEGGGHAIRLTGWGVSPQGVKYWIIANSWGTDFGEKGYFWIEMGKNVVGIEESASAPTLNYTTSTPCKKEAFCDSFDQVLKLDYKDSKSPTFMFRGECIMEVKRDAKTGKLSPAGEPTYTARVILNAPKPPVASYWWRDDKISLINDKGEVSHSCEKKEKHTKWLCVESKYDQKPIPFAVTEKGVTYKYESSKIWVGKAKDQGDKGVDARALFADPNMPQVLQFLDIDGKQMYVFGKGPKGKMVAGIASYPKDPQDPAAAFTWVTKPGAASKFLSC